MARSGKKQDSTDSEEFTLFDESTTPADTDVEDDLPKDEAGRAKIKQQYVDLLGIRIVKLRGRILNRERINKTLEGIYFICNVCGRVCHNLDDGLVEDEANVNNLCNACHKAQSVAPKPAKASAAVKKAPGAKKAKPEQGPSAKKASVLPKTVDEKKRPSKPKPTKAPGAKRVR